jgi:rhodanese-related sulfurtransferase
MLSSGVQVVDALPSHEYSTAHIHGAIHIPVGNILRDAPKLLDRARPVVVYCRDSLWDLSTRAAAQLEVLGFTDVRHYFRGKADWMVRGLPMDPPAPLSERMHAFRYFVNNLAPGLRSFWIHFSDRVRVDEFMRDDLVRLGPDDVVSTAADSPTPRAVVLDRNGALLGTIERPDAVPRALDAMNPNPQTIRPDMSPRLAKKLLKSNPYLIVTTEKGKYLGRYAGS